MAKCTISFDNNENGIFYAGQTLSGSIELNTDKVRKTKGVCLKIEGYANCNWTETEHHHKKKSKNVLYSGRDDYLNTISYLVGSNEGNQIEILPGVHTYNFSCMLPQMLPTSFEAKFGHIRYLVKLVMDRPMKFDLTYTVAFTVLKQLDLNYENPALRIPTKMETIKSFYWGFCKTKPMYICVSIPFSGYVAGQSVNIEIEINNQSRVDIEELKVSLKKIIHYNSQTPRMRTKEEILTESEIRCGGHAAHKKGRFDQQLVIPAVPPTNISYCRVLTVSYEIHVLAKVPGIYRNPVVKLPITIGTVPLTSYQNGSSLGNQYNAGPNLSACPVRRILSPIGNNDFGDTINRAGPSSSNDSMSNDLAPPSYHEAMGTSVELSEEGEHQMGQAGNSYVPRYPVYNFNQQNGSNQLQSFSYSPPQPNNPPANGSISDSAIIQKY
ncbi:unnamed protein product [Diamesa tonsa]